METYPLHREQPMQPDLPVMDLQLPGTLPPLSLALTDGCDQCGWVTERVKVEGAERITYIYRAQALVAVRLTTGHDLHFCGHHYHQQEDALVTSGLIDQILDKRGTINASPYSGSVYGD
jgi:hypothetical protein